MEQENRGYQCLLLDEETAGCFEGLYIGDPEELKKKLAVGVIRSKYEDLAPCGLMVFHADEDELAIEWACVKGEEDEKPEIIRKMLNSILASAWTSDFSYLSVLVPDGQEWLKQVYETYGFDFDDGEYGEIETELSRYTGRMEKDDSIVSFQDLLSGELTSFYKGLKENGVACPLSLPLQKNNYLPESVAFLQEGKIHALLLFRKEERENEPPRLIIPWFYADKKAKMLLSFLFSHAAEVLTKTYPADTKLCFALANPKLLNIVNQFFSSYTFRPYHFGYKVL